MRTPRTRLIARLAPFGATLLLLLPGCRSTAGGEGEPELETYVLVALVRGEPDPRPDEEEVRVASEGHFANMAGLSEAAVLLVAGPMADPESPVRGLFLMDCDGVEEAREHVETDPAVAAGLLVPQLTSFRSTPALRELPALRARAEAERLAEAPDDPARGFVGREYVLATCNRGELAVRRLAPAEEQGRVLLHGLLGPPAEGSALFVLDVTTLEEAEALLREARLIDGVGASWALDGWWATEAVSRLGGS